MSKFNSEKVLPRYLFLAVMLTIIGLAVVTKAGITMTVKKATGRRWLSVYAAIATAYVLIVVIY